MNVRPPSDTRPAAAAAAVGAVRPEQSAAGASGSAAGSVAASTDSRDRVELSARGRAEAAQQSRPPQSPEVELARVALRSQPSLSPERLHELRERVRTGHYDQPEVVARVAAAATRDLSGPAAG
jgi:hypothetical protein